MFRKREHFFAAVILIFAILIAAAILSFPFVLKEIKDEEPLISKIKLSVKTFVKPEQAPLVSEPTVAPDKIEFRVDPEIAVIKDSELLPVGDWKTYFDKTHEFEVKYPNEWFVIEGVDGDIYFSSSSSGNLYDYTESGKVVEYKNWARAKFSFKTKLKIQTLEDWIDKLYEFSGPGSDKSVQYILIGDKKFLGSSQFIQNVAQYNWTNAYFEISSEKVLIITFIQKATRAQSDFKDQSKIFYTMLKTLKAAKNFKAKSVLLGGGVAANRALRGRLESAAQKELPGVCYYQPKIEFTGDNAAMIAAAAYVRLKAKKLKLPTLKKEWKTLKAKADWRI